MKKLLMIAVLSASALVAGESAAKVGVVNFATCVTDSKYGKQEQSSFESMKKQMTTLIEDNEKQLREISEKFQDKDYLDGLSPDAEEELKVKFRNLSEELNRYQQQYYQVLNQANYKLIQSMGKNINSAAEKVAANKGINMVVNQEACFYCLPSLDITAEVIKEMDKNFELDVKKLASAAPAAPAEKAVEKDAKKPVATPAPADKQDAKKAAAAPAAEKTEAKK